MSDFLTEIQEKGLTFDAKGYTIDKQNMRLEEWKQIPLFVYK